MQVLSSLSGIPFYAPSAGYAPTNSADVSAIASAYQVVSSTATQLYAGTAYVTSVNDNPLSASRAGQAANASMANTAYYDGTGRLISALPDSATVSAIAYSYAESAASSKLDESATANFYPTSNPSGFISGVDLSDYATTADLANKLDTTAQVVTAVSTATSDVGGDTYTWVLGINGTSISAMTSDVAGVARTATYDSEGRRLTALAASSSLANYQTTANMSGYLPFSSIHADANSAITSINGSSIGGGGGTTYVSPSGTLWISGESAESTDSAFIPGVATETFVQSGGNFDIGTTQPLTVAGANKVTIQNAGWFDGTIYVSGNGTLVSSVAHAGQDWPQAFTAEAPISIGANGWFNVNNYSAFNVVTSPDQVVPLMHQSAVQSAYASASATQATAQNVLYILLPDGV